MTILLVPLSWTFQSPACRTPTQVHRWFVCSFDLRIWTNPKAHHKHNLSFYIGYVVSNSVVLLVETLEQPKWISNTFNIKFQKAICFPIFMQLELTSWVCCQRKYTSIFCYFFMFLKNYFFFFIPSLLLFLWGGGVIIIISILTKRAWNHMLDSWYS